MTYKVVDFFCGAGGFSEGFHQAGFEIIKAFDIWEPAILTHNKNHPSCDSVAINKDIYELSLLNDEEFEKLIPDSEIIIGSPPCVAFSSSNRSGKADKSLGILLLKAYLRIVARKLFKKNSKLKYWILENVSNIEKYIKPEYTMAELGLPGNSVLKVKGSNSGTYFMKYYGVPSNRKRYICGNFPKPKPTLTDNNLVTLKNILDGLGSPKEKSREEIKDINYGFKMSSVDVSDHHYIKEISEFEWRKAKRQKLDKGYMGKMSFPENFNKPARTIMATMTGASRESFILPYKEGRYRFPTIREVATIMSFPIDYRFYGETDATKYKLIGNAVPPKFSYAVAKAIVCKDGLNNNIVTKRKEFLTDDFCNLNGKEYVLKVEKEKNKRVKYRYHIPYMKIDSYRTELLNQFDNGYVKWITEIHRSQGPSAKVYRDFDFTIDFLSKKDKYEIDKFISLMAVKIKSFQELQENYRKTMVYRKNNKIIGPDELLEETKAKLTCLDNNYSGKLWVEELTVEIPQKIILSYYILCQIL
ncbi:MAG: DNA cytosine methyltransferase, partial [Tetragenococcus koreensis]|nr:DNA cytosine methyltransferase [Tetragenococcus koreensis]